MDPTQPREFELECVDCKTLSMWAGIPIMFHFAQFSGFACPRCKGPDWIISEDQIKKELENHGQPKQTERR